jgi:hypothetical protein
VKSPLRKTPEEQSPRLLVNYFPAACECFTLVAEPQNWDRFSRPSATTPCCKACTLTPHPFIYGHLGCSQGVGRHNCGCTDVRVCA